MSLVPQPYRTDGHASGAKERQDDLFRQLRQEMSTAGDATVRIIVGRAGIGKSCLFTSLFGDLYEDFLDSKNRLRRCPRPIPLLPEHLKQAQSMRTDALIENFLRTDVASPMTSKTFKWLLVNGYATWLLDGLDELYSGDPGFFDFILDLITDKGSRAQVTIWCRDSLLTTSQEFAEFQETCSGGDVLKIYRLSDWQRKQKRQFVWIKKKGRLPKAGDGDSAEVSEFLDVLDSNSVLKSISGLPFYCSELLQHKDDGDLKRFGDEVELLNYTVDTMVSREIAKGMFDQNSFDEDGLNDWLETIAAEYVEGQYAGLASDEVQEYAELVLRDGLDRGVRDHILTSLRNFPLFQSGNEGGQVAFVHDLVADVVAARHYRKLINGGRKDTFRRLEHVDVDYPPLLRFMVHGIEEGGLNTLRSALRRVGKDRSFSVALTLMMLVSPGKDTLRKIETSFEDRLLVGVRFVDRDLAELSFRGSDLTNAVFERCDLRRASFPGTHLSRTMFRDCDLRGADLRRSRAQSIVAGQRMLSDVNRIHEWFAESSGVRDEGVRCPTAQQFVYLFGKYVTPLGEPKRDRLPERALVSGKRVEGAAVIEDCIKAAVSAGFMQPDHRERYSRTSGNQYAEMVEFVAHQRISAGIGRMLEKLCPRPACLHQL